MSFSIIEGTLSAAVADAGTFTASFPSGKDAGNFYRSTGHKLVMGQTVLAFPEDFDLSCDATQITITNKTGASWASGTTYKLQVEEQGKREYRDADTRELLKNAYQVTEMLITLGAPDVLDADGIAVAQAVAAAGNLTLAGALTSGGVATFDVPRGVPILSAGNDSGITFTVTGTDLYGDAMDETITGANASTAYGLKAFKTVTQIAASAAAAGNVSAGSSDVIGIPVFIPSKGNVLAVMQDGVPLPKKTIIPFEIEETQLLAGTSEFVVTPDAGFIDRATSVVTKAVTTGGTLTLELGGAAVTGLTVTVADAAAVGDIDTDTPTDTAGVDTTRRVAARGAIEIVPDATWATAGEVNGVIEINSEGVIAIGDITGGGATATTGDVRGTYVPPVACDGSKVFQMIVALPDPGNVGVAQYAA